MHFTTNNFQAKTYNVEYKVQTRHAFFPSHSQQPGKIRQSSTHHDHYVTLLLLKTIRFVRKRFDRQKALQNINKAKLKLIRTFEEKTENICILCKQARM